MSKNIIICLDGTWNKPDEKDSATSSETNVKILYDLCVNDKETQITYYDKGIGTKWFDKTIGGVFGVGLSENVRQAYRKLSKTFEKNDKVFIFGFSRGAYTARSLAGLIFQCGLLSSRKATKKNVEKVYDVYKNGNTVEEKSKNIKCPIRMIGVWDTVGALGIPVDFLKNTKKLIDKNLQFHDTKLNNEIRAAYHAVAIDEQRKAFTPTLWDVSKKWKGQIVEQVWFAGVHADVGGGYSERYQSNIALQWMLKKTKKHGMKLVHNYDELSRPIHDPHNKIYGPKTKRKVAVTEKNITKVHSSVLKKMEVCKGYKPRALVDLKSNNSLKPYEIVD